MYLLSLEWESGCGKRRVSANLGACLPITPPQSHPLAPVSKPSSHTTYERFKDDGNLKMIRTLLLWLAFILGKCSLLHISN